MFRTDGMTDGIPWEIEGKVSFEGSYFAIVRVGSRARRTEPCLTEEAAERAADNLLADMLEEAGL
jgi:hypothetical protein